MLLHCSEPIRGGASGKARALCPGVEGSHGFIRGGGRARVRSRDPRLYEHFKFLYEEMVRRSGNTSTRVLTSHVHQAG